MSEVLNKELALVEVTKWLDCKKVKEKKRVAYKEAIESLVDAVSEGTLILNDDFSFTHRLDFPVGTDGLIKEFNYKARLDVSTIQKYANGATGGDARVLATISALTAQPKELVSKMDTEDYGIASSVAIFFL